MSDTNAVLARRWIAERLRWERFLEQVAQPAPEVADTPAREAA